MMFFLLSVVFVVVSHCGITENAPEEIIYAKRNGGENWAWEDLVHIIWHLFPHSAPLEFFYIIHRMAPYVICNKIYCDKQNCCVQQRFVYAEQPNSFFLWKKVTSSIVPGLSKTRINFTWTHQNIRTEIISKK